MYNVSYLAVYLQTIRLQECHGTILSSAPDSIMKRAVMLIILFGGI